MNNTYQYDKAGNRAGWVTNHAPDTGAKLTVTWPQYESYQISHGDKLIVV